MDINDFEFMVDQILHILEIKEIKVVAEGVLKDSLKSSLTQKEELPHVFLAGKKWKLIHHCGSCNKEVNASLWYNLNTLYSILSLHGSENKFFLKAVGELLDLTLIEGKDDNKFDIYYYQLSGSYSHVAKFLYYKCPHCSSKYIVAFTFLDGDSDRSPEPDRIYIEKIVMVEFDEKEFMEAYNK